MNRFVIVDGLPYLLSHGKTFAVRWDDKGFTVGMEVNLASIPSVTHSELAIKAKCAGRLNSIDVQEPEKQEQEDQKPETPANDEQEDQKPEAPANDEQEDQKPEAPAEIDLEGMTVKALKEYAAEHGIDLGDATKKADILAAIKGHQDVIDHDSDG